MMHLAGLASAVLVLFCSPLLAASQTEPATTIFEIAPSSQRVSPLHQADLQPIIDVDIQTLKSIKKGQSAYFDLGNGRQVKGLLVRDQFIDVDANQTKTLFSLGVGKGSIEFNFRASQLKSMTMHDFEQFGHPRVFQSQFDADGRGDFVEMNPHQHFCIHMPTDSQASAASRAPSAIALAQTPEEAVLRTLQGRPTANKVLYINYWGGVLDNTSWNVDYTADAAISYAPFNVSGSSSEFDLSERHLMWFAWHEVVEDYAQFDVNVTTDQQVYAAASAEDRSMIIVTPSDAWFPPSAGGVAYLDSFGSNYRGIGWAWNLSAGSLGGTISHETGHQLGLYHDGGSANPNYYSGHGSWGPIMGAPFNQAYVQWSKGEYTGANNYEDDISIIGSVLGTGNDAVGDTPLDAYPLSTSSTAQSFITAQGNSAADTDVFSFTLPVADNVTVNVAPLLGLEAENLGTNLSLTATLNGPSTGLPFTASPTLSPTTNALEFSGLLAPGQYTVTVTAQSLNADWTTGFGEYGNGGLYQVSVTSSVLEPDLVTSLNISDKDVYGGQILALSGQIVNIGAATALDSSYSLVMSTDDQIESSDTIVSGHTAYSVIAPRQVILTSAEAVAPNMSDSIWYGICMSAAMGESIVSNNCSNAVEVQVTAATQDIDIAAATDTDVNVAELDWQRGGDTSFYRQTADYFEDNDAARSGIVADNEVSYLQTTVMVTESSLITFYWKVSSELNFDYFTFYVDNVEITKISGEQDWVKVGHVLPIGQHTLKWVYAKDAFAKEGQDAAWLDSFLLVDKHVSIEAQSANKPEGDTGVTDYSFTLQRTGSTAQVASVRYTVSPALTNGAQASDFGGVFPTGSHTFAVGQSTSVLNIGVSGDYELEQDEHFVVTLSQPLNVSLFPQMSSAQGSILNDESDLDGDLVVDALDNCPLVANASQVNTDLNIPDGDLLGDACDTDDDADGVIDSQDNCPLESNPTQAAICELCMPIKVGDGKFALICL